MKGSYWRIINHSELNFWQTLRWISHQKQTWIFFNFRKWSRFKIQKSFSWQVGIVAMQCKVLQSIAMYCNVLQIVEEQCIAMYCIVTMQCKILQSIVRNVLQNIAKYCKYCKVLQRISTYCKVFQLIATYCNELHRRKVLQESNAWKDNCRSFPENTCWSELGNVNFLQSRKTCVCTLSTFYSQQHLLVRVVKCQHSKSFKWNFTQRKANKFWHNFSAWTNLQNGVFGEQNILSNQTGFNLDRTS